MLCCFKKTSLFHHLYIRNSEKRPTTGIHTTIRWQHLTREPQPSFFRYLMSRTSIRDKCCHQSSSKWNDSWLYSILHHLVLTGHAYHYEQYLQIMRNREYWLKHITHQRNPHTKSFLLNFCNLSKQGEILQHDGKCNVNN